MARRNHHVCPTCGRAVADTGDGVFWSMPKQGASTQPNQGRHAYVHLQRHNRPDGSPCPAWTARVIAPATPA